MKRMSHKKKFLLTAVMAGLAFVMSSCGTSNGWDAIPISEGDDTCYQITRWEAGGFKTKFWAEGVYCLQEVK